MSRFAVIGVAMLCLAGCGGDPSAPQLPPSPFQSRPPAHTRPPEPRHHPADRSTLLAQLDAARAYWLVKRPTAYELTVSLRCFCNAGAPAVSRVGGLTVTATRGGHPWGPSLRTVEMLFSEARRAVTSDADDVQVEFDSRFRHPTRVVVDKWRDAFDDEREWVVQLRVLR